MNIEDSQISTSAEAANAGDITIGTKDFYMSNALVTTSANTSGNGGDIELSSDFILMDTGFIQGNTGGADFSGGNVVINSDFLIVTSQSLRAGGDTREQFVANSGINVIQAAAPDGVSGDVNIGGLEFDISGELVDIGGEVLSLDGLHNNPCNVASGSSLSDSGKGGLVIQPDGINSPTLSQQEFQKRLPATFTSNKDQLHSPSNIADVSRQADELAYLKCHWQALQSTLIQEGT